MATEYVIVSTPEAITVVSEGAQGPSGPQGQPGDNDSPSFIGPVLFTLLGTESVKIDARTHPREVTLGVFRIEHTAGISGTRPITLNIDCNGYGNTHGIVVDYKATNIGVSENHIFELNIDTDNSTGGHIQAISVSKSGTGLADVWAVETLPDVNVIKQETGAPIFLTQAWKLSGITYIDTTSAFADGVNVSLFDNNNDYIICGNDSIFNQLEVYLITKASNTINAVFSYSIGNNIWQTFTPTDGTNGFTVNGSIMWPNLVGWTPSSVNGITKYYIRIQRTRNALSIIPVESNIRIISSVSFGWDKNADVSVRKLKASGLPTYADRSAATIGGLVTGQFYQTSAGVLMIV